MLKDKRRSIFRPFCVLHSCSLCFLYICVWFQVSQDSVVTSTPFPVGNLGQDVILDCKFQTKSSQLSSDVSITWQKEGLSGVVYQYQNNVDHLQEQNPQFKNRVKLFPDAIPTGNASLLMRTVRMQDEGVYRCSVTTPGVTGSVGIHLRVGGKKLLHSVSFIFPIQKSVVFIDGGEGGYTAKLTQLLPLVTALNVSFAAYSAPNITKSNRSLIAYAQSWLPKPDVTWSDQNGTRLNSSTQFYDVQLGIVQVTSSIQVQVTQGTFTCVIQNALVTATTEATVKGIDFFFHV